jgi:hypothetical protein
MPSVETLTAVILGAQFLVLIAAAVFANRQVREARRSREEESRPFVVVDFEAKKGMFYVVVTNTGRTIARDVRFKFEPALAGTLDREGDNPWSLASLKMFSDGIPSLPPGKRIATLFDSSFQRTREEWPDAYEVEIEYADASRKRRFSERILLDLGIYWGLMLVEEKGVHDLHKRLEELVREAKRWGASGGGLLVLTPSELSARHESLNAARHG